MDVLVVYDSYFGNTEKVAQAISAAYGPAAQAVRASDVKPEMLKGIKLLIVGSPTRAFQPSDGTKRFLKSLAPNALTGVRVAAFDTRIAVEDANSKFLKIMVRLFGYAAKPIGSSLTRRGGSLAEEPEGFIVNGTEGPLKDGELERAAAWAPSIA